MARYLEIGRRTYALRFTLRAILRANQATGKPFSALFGRGTRGLCALLYCALCEDAPRLTLQGAAALLRRALREHPRGEVREALLSALAESGFDRDGADEAQAERLLDAAARAGYPDPEALPGMTLREIDRALVSFCVRSGRAASLPMTAGQMADALRHFAGGIHEHT
ncbi:MAG: hypothetical protein IJS53_02050 [Clostridia bacterium]|nr:hypothetical protein [Clostridia bacterium]